MRTAIFIISVICCLGLRAQDTTYIHIFEAPGVERSEAMIQSENGDFILVGSTSSFDLDDTDFHVLRMDSDLNLIWSRHYGYPLYSERAIDVLEDVNNEIYVIGYTNQSGYDLRLIKLSAEGELIWETTLGTDDWDFCSEMMFDQDQNILIAGNTYGYASELNSQAWLIKVSPEGNVIWEKHFGDQGDDVFNDIEILDNGEIVLAGNYFSVENDKELAWLVKCDSNGESIWELKPEELESQGMDVLVNNDLIHFHLRKRHEGEWVFTNAGYFSSGEEAFFQNHFPQGSNWYHKSVVFNSSQIALLGTSTFYGNGGLETKYDLVDNTGDLTIKATYGGFFDDVATDLVLAENGLIYISGYTVSYDVDSQDYFILYSTDNSDSDNQVIVEIKQNDELITSVDFTELREDNETLVYPNPCNNRCYLSGVEFPAVLKVFDEYGRIVISEKIWSNYLPVQNLAPGSYVFEIHSEKLWMKERVIILR